MKTRFLLVILFCGFVGVCPALAYMSWDGGAGTSDWNTVLNWNPDTVPGVADKAVFQRATGPVVTATTPTIKNISLGGSAGGIVTLSGGSITTTAEVVIGNTSTDNGTLIVNSGTFTIGTQLNVGDTGTATINMYGGIITVGQNFSVANGSGSTGTVNLNGGIITCGVFRMAYGGTATPRLDLGGGTLIVNGDATSNVAAWAGNGWITGYGSASNVRYDYNITTTGKTTVWAASSNKATNPTPANGATNVARNSTLSWTGASGAASHNVYFGTTSPGAPQGNQTATTFTPGALAAGTTYYWRIDEVSGPNTVTGDVWSFTTATDTFGPASNPSPVNGATSTSISTTLSWAAGIGAVSHNIYFGNSFSDVNIASNPNVLPGRGNQTATTFNPGTLATSTTYYWRIDEIGGPNTVRGAVWSFTTQSGKATNPNPVNSASDVATNAMLSWTAGPGAISHDVYFDTENPPSLQINQSSTTYNPGTLANSTTYYWRIDEVGGSGTVEGDVWSYTTVAAVSTPVYPYLTWRHEPTNSVVVNWVNADAQGDSTVDYGTTISYGSSVTVPTITNTHHVELTGLTAGQTYHYRIRSNDGTIGSDKTYTAPVASPSTFRFAVYGDVRGASTKNEPYYTRHQTLCNWILAQDFDFAFETGDTVWAGSTGLSVYWPDFFRLESNLSKSKVIMATMGNHEVQDADNSANYQSLYSEAFPTNGTAGNYGRVYSFNYGNAHFVCLSSFQVDTAMQGVWLDEDLAAARANPNIKWIFAFMHYPLYTTSGHQGDDTQIRELTYWRPIFDQYHVDIVFGGHNHVYERSKSLKAGVVVPDGNGTVYVTSGLGGANFDGTASSPLFESLYANNTLAACVTINRNVLTVNAIANATGQIIDSFTLEKPAEYIPADLNKDGIIDFKDVRQLTAHWLDTGYWP